MKARIDIKKPDGRLFASLHDATLSDSRYTLCHPDGTELTKDATYQTVECLGSGGFGAVVLSKDRLHIPRAVKFVKDLEVTEEAADPDSSKQFIKEILIPNLSVFKHVIPVIDYGQTDGVEDAGSSDAAANNSLWNCARREISMDKLYKRIQERAFELSQLFIASLARAICRLYQELEKLLKHCMKNRQRSRMTTLEMLEAGFDPKLITQISCSLA